MHHSARLKSNNPASRALARIEGLEARTLLAAALDDRLGEAAGDVSAIAFDRSGLLHRVWRDDAGRLMYAHRLADQTSWTASGLVDPRSIGESLSLAIDPAGLPMVVYTDTQWKDLLVARLSNGKWDIRGIDKVGDVGERPDLAFSPNGRPFVTYHDLTNDDLKLAWTNRKGKWITHRLAETGSVGDVSSLVIDPVTGLLRVAFNDRSNGSLNFARQATNGTFSVETIDAALPGGTRSISLALSSSGALAVAYDDASAGDLKFAEFTGGWLAQRVASQGDQGQFASLSYHRQTPVVTYFNRTIGTVYQASRAGGTWSRELIGWASGEVATAVDSTGRFAVSMRSLDGDSIITPGNTAQKLPEENDASARLVEWIIVGGSSSVASDRGVGWSIKTKGWKNFVNTKINPLKSLGMKRVLLQNPFGTLRGEPMQFDQFLEARDGGLKWLTDGFVAAMKPVTAAGIEVIGYLGSLPLDDEFKNLSFDDYMLRVKQSMQPLLDAGMSIAFDAVVSAYESDRAFQVVQSLRDSGVRVYAENRPRAGATYWQSHATIHAESMFQHTDPARNSTMRWASTNDQLLGEVLRHVSDPPSGTSFATWQAKQAKTILAEGDTAMISFRHLSMAGLTANSLLSQALASRTPSSGGTTTTMTTPRIATELKL